MSEEKKESLHAGALEIDKALTEYYPESDLDAVKKIEEWQDLKFGLLMHWAPSSQWGIVESWSLCSEDEDWCKRDIKDYTEYKKKYEGLKKTFNPTKFDPSKWAKAAKKAGMKYVVFTTKHHDGFCMYDSKFTDYKVTDEECPYSKSPKANLTKEIFNEFRKEDFMIGAYFSKPDWHSNDFWWKRFATPDRNANYDVNKHPDKWEKFVEFSHNQVDELVTDYGKVDILWFDGCWVRKMSDEEIIEERKISSSHIHRVQNQDIKMGDLKNKVREKQPGIIFVDRAVTGPNQNYLTPENQIPDKTLPYPWETCMPITPSWSYEPGLEYKSSHQLIHLLVDVVAKGGNFLLNIAPTAEGDYEPEAYDRLEAIADWIEVNSEAIYYSKPLPPYKENNVCFTQLKDGTKYLICLCDENDTMLPIELSFDKFIPDNIEQIKLLGSDVKLEYKKNDMEFVIKIPQNTVMPNKYAFVIKIK